MLCTLIGMLIKLVGIIIAIPNTWRQYKNWRDKETAKLWVANSIYLKRGTRASVPAWKRLAFKLSRMPNPHLWSKKYDRPASENDKPKRSLALRLLRLPRRKAS